ncbi:MAG: hypothetical protein PHV62_07770, partial [Sulfuricurvum sp.]|nr:hypothetical protein [Sulfuricurvum sp.]
ASYTNVPVGTDGTWNVDISGEEFKEETTYTATATATDGTNISAPDFMTDGYADTVPLAEGAQNTVIANAEGMAAEASLGINWGADGYKEGSITTPLVEGDTNYVMGIASNGDTFVVTSGGDKLVYMTLEDGTIAAVKEGTEETVFTVAVNTEGTGYITTMVGTVDAHIVTETVVETGGSVNGSVTGSATDSVTFTLPADKQGGGNEDQLVLTAKDPSTNITLTLTATGDAPDPGHDTVNYSNQRIGVDGGDSIDTRETLTLNISSDTAGVKITSIGVVTDSLDGTTYDHDGNVKQEGEIAQAELFNGTTPIGTDTIDGTGSGASSDESWLVSDSVTSPIGESFDTVKFTVNTGDGYGILINQGITANYTYDVNVPTTTTTTTTTTTESLYDFTIPLTFSGVDGDSDPVTTDFHITFDANNDGVLTSIDSGETSAAVSVTESTVTTTALVHDTDAQYLPADHPLSDGSESITTVETNEYSVNVDTSSAQVTLEDFGTYTDSDVLAARVSDSVLIDGGAAGIDILVLSEDEGIDFSTLDNNPVTNIEVIDLTQSGDHEMTSITLDNVVDITNENNDLTILRDNTDDSVTTDVTTLENTGEVTIGSDTFDMYANVENTDPTVTLKIEQVDNAPIV